MSFTSSPAPPARKRSAGRCTRGAKRKLDEMGIPNERRRARQLTRQDYDRFDYLLCMDEWNVRNIMRIIKKDPENKVHMLLEYAGERREIADPWYTGNFDETYDDLTKGCTAFLEYLDAEL